MKPNKKVFFAVLEGVAEHCKSEGFVAHPAYVSAWEPSNQAYQATLIRSDVTDFIDQLDVSFYPSWNEFRFKINRSANVFGINALADIPNDAHAWSDCWLYQPFNEYLLCNGSAWNIFPMKNGFPVSKRKPLDVEAEARKVCRAFERQSEFLFEALKGDYEGRLVDVTPYKLVRPH